MVRLAFAKTALFLLATFTTHISTVAESGEFAIDDYFEVDFIEEAAISSDGKNLVYVLADRSLTNNEVTRRVFVSSSKPNATPRELQDLSTARGFAWVPNSKKLVFLRTVGSRNTLQTFDTATGEIESLSSAAQSVDLFDLNVSGEVIAWTELDSSDFEEPLSKQFESKQGGTVVVSEAAVLYDFVDPYYPNVLNRGVHRLWYRKKDGSQDFFDVPGLVKDLSISDDGKRISINFVAHTVPKSVRGKLYTSVGILDTEESAFFVVFEAISSGKMYEREYYTGGEWLPGSSSIVVQKTTMENAPWLRRTLWTTCEIAETGTHVDNCEPWQETDLSGPAIRVFPISDEEIYVEAPVNARRRIFSLSTKGDTWKDVYPNLQESVHTMDVARSSGDIIFVAESLESPPELYVARKTGTIEKATSINESIEQKQLPIVSSIHWKGDDGTLIQGWLMLPRELGEISDPLPLLTFVHGGPGAPYMDEFNFYFSSANGVWPYPLDVLSLSDIAVFIPNYRGTKTFGYDYSNPSQSDKEPISDIVNGIDEIVSRGIADPLKLAVAGHSHGAWLGSLMMVRATDYDFVVGSFAEGGLNTYVAYYVMSEWINRYVHAPREGELTANLNRYLSLSSDLQFDGLMAAQLFEAGARSLAAITLGSAKLSRFAGLPTEFVVYPAGHNIGNVLPKLQKDSAERNLDWFRFWLLGEEDADPGKRQRYERWRMMRDERCARSDLRTPPYCPHE